MDENQAQDVARLTNCAIHQGETLILDNISLAIKSTDFVYLIGKTGSGKSSFLKTLYADLPLQSGEAEIVGFSLDKLKQKEVPFLRRSLGIIFQDFQLLTDRTVAENLSFVLTATGWKDKQSIKSKIEKVLSQVGLNGKGYRMPHELSGGEQQRVVIARALLNKPKLILADEPTGNLDPDTSDEIMKLLFSLHQSEGVGVLMATHNYQLIEKFPSKIFNVSNGSIAAQEHLVL